MKSHSWYIKQARRRGAALMLMAAVLMAAIAISAYAINVAYIQYTRAELQIVTDVSTRAACRALVDTGQQSAAYLAAQRLADANKVAGRVMTVNAGDLDFNAATRISAADTYAYAAASRPNSVHFRSSFFERSQDAIPMLLPSFTMALGFRPVKEATATQAELDIAIVLDCSSSMLAPSTQPALPEGLLQLPLPAQPTARWWVAQAGISQMLAVFRDSPQQERVTLTTFNNVSLLNYPLTTDYAAIEAAIALQGTAYLGGLSSLTDGVNSAMTMLGNGAATRAYASRVILLISDGNENFGTGALAAADRAAAAQIMVYTISLGIDANQILMDNVARRAHGKSFSACTPDEFVQAIEDVNKHLPVLITQ